METEKSLQLFLASYNFQFTYKTLFISFCRLKTQSLMLVIVFYLLKSTPQYIKRNINFFTQKKGFQNFFYSHENYGNENFISLCKER